MMQIISEYDSNANNNAQNIEVMADNVDELEEFLPVVSPPEVESQLTEH